MNVLDPNGGRRPWPWNFDDIAAAIVDLILSAAAVVLFGAGIVGFLSMGMG